MDKLNMKKKFFKILICIGILVLLYSLWWAFLAPDYETLCDCVETIKIRAGETKSGRHIPPIRVLSLDGNKGEGRIEIKYPQSGFKEYQVRQNEQIKETGYCVVEISDRFIKLSFYFPCTPRGKIWKYIEELNW